MSVIIISVCVLKQNQNGFDKEAFEPWFTELTTGNPLNFPEYEEKIAKTQEKTGLSEGIVIGKTKIYGEETVLWCN